MIKIIIGLLLSISLFFFKSVFRLIAGRPTWLSFEGAVDGEVSIRHRIIDWVLGGILQFSFLVPLVLILLFVSYTREITGFFGIVAGKHGINFGLLVILVPVTLLVACMFYLYFAFFVVYTADDLLAMYSFTLSLISKIAQLVR